MFNEVWVDSSTQCIHVWYISLTFVIKVKQMWVQIPYMDPTRLHVKIYVVYVSKIAMPTRSLFVLHWWRSLCQNIRMRSLYFSWLQSSMGEGPADRSSFAADRRMLRIGWSWVRSTACLQRLPLAWPRSKKPWSWSWTTTSLCKGKSTMAPWLLSDQDICDFPWTPTTHEKWRF